MPSSNASEDSPCLCAGRRLVIHILDTATIVVVVGLQGSILNNYLIRHYTNSIGPYFYYLADLFVVIVFVGTLITSYHYLTKKEAIEDKLKRKAVFFNPARLIQEVESNLLPWSHKIVGVMPFSYISWLVYVIVLLSKVIVIFQSGLVEELSENNLYGPNLLKLMIALASLVFLSLVEGHNWSKRGSARYSFVTSTCARNGIEMFDAVAFLSLRMEGSTKEAWLKDLVLVMSTFTFFLPALSLLKLSLLDFASEKTCLQVSVFQDVLRLTTVDLPFLAFRVYMWINYKENASLFLMINVFNILLIFRTLCPDIKALAEDRFGINPLSLLSSLTLWSNRVDKTLTTEQEG